MNKPQLLAFFTIKNKYIPYLCSGLLHFFVHNTEYIGQKAVINTPVVDMSSSFPLCANSPASGQEALCRRANQALYNEIVDCIAVVADAVKIDLKKVIYGYDEYGNAYSSFWTIKDGLTLLNNINPVLLSMIPDLKNEQQPKLCLCAPWNNFSVGTYFVRVPAKDTEYYYAIYFPRFVDNAFTIEYVEKNKTLCVEKRSEEEMRTLFINLLYGLIDQASSAAVDGVIPYVWGGCSFVTPNKKDDFFYAEGAWHRPCCDQIYKGYDCSGLIWRMAQCVGISFPWKVSKIIAQHCRPINDNNVLQNGDIIWFEGHVMVVADIEFNTLIEAAGYANGYGCVHCVALSERFANVTTYNDLMDMYSKKQPISLLNNAGQEVKKVLIKLLKLMPPYSNG